MSSEMVEEGLVNRDGSGGTDSLPVEERCLLESHASQNLLDSVVG